MKLPLSIAAAVISISLSTITFASPHKAHHSLTQRKHYDVKRSTETQRYQLWLGIKAYDDRAFRNAGGNPNTDDSSNMSMNDFNLYDSLVEKYQAQFESRNHLSDNDVVSIKDEAFKKHWAGMTYH